MGSWRPGKWTSGGSAEALRGRGRLLLLAFFGLLAVAGAGRASAGAPPPGPGGRRLAQAAAEAEAVAAPGEAADGETAADRRGQRFESHHPVVAVLLAFVGGLGLTLTPCVYPLIPVTVSLVGATSGGGRLDGFVRSAIYVFGISVTYSVAGVAAALGGAQFGDWLQHPAVYAALAVIFVLLAGAMFDLYSIELSSQRLQRLQARLRGSAGLLGVWLIGILSGAAATACIAPVILGVLVYVGRRGSLLLGFSMFFAMAWGMGVPLVAVGTFTGLAESLPKAGEWMGTVKRAFGLALMGAAFYFLAKSRLLPEFWFQMALGTFLLVGGVFVGAFDSLRPDSGWWPRARKAAGLLLVLGAVAAFGRPVVRALPAAPPMRAEGPTEVRWITDPEAALQAARRQEKPVMIDFWAEWCEPCKRMLRTTYKDPRVIEESQRFVSAKIDYEQLTDRQKDRLAEEYNVRAVPTVVFVGTDGASKTVVGYKGPDEMLSLMQAVR